jgi:hypothetical protein
LFDVSPGWGDAPLETTLYWTITAPIGSVLECQVDIDGDGTFDNTLSPCGLTSWLAAKFTEAGRYRPRLVVTDGNGHLAEATTTVFANQVVFADNVLHPDGWNGLLSVDVLPDQLVFHFKDDASIPQIDVDAILWGTAGGGYSRKVVSTQSQDHDFIVATQKVPLDVVLKKASVGFRDAPSSSLDPMASALVQSALGRSESALDQSLSFSIELGDLQLVRPDGTPLIDAPIKFVKARLSGGITLKEFYLDIDWFAPGLSPTDKVKEFTVDLETTGKLEIGLEFPDSLMEPVEWKLSEIPLGTIPVGVVILVPKIRPSVTFDVKVFAGFSYEFGVAFGLHAGASFKNGAWAVAPWVTPKIQPTFELPDSVLPSAKVGAEAKVTFGPDFRLMVMDLIGPNFDIRPFLKGVLEIEFYPKPDACVSASVGADAVFGLMLELFSQEILKANVTATLVEWVFFKACKPDLADESPDAWDASDLGETGYCGDGACNGSETQLTCCQDCGCDNDEQCDLVTGQCTACSSNTCATNGWTSGKHCDGSSSVTCQIQGTCVVATSVPCDQGCDPATHECANCTADCSSVECGPDPKCGKDCAACSSSKECISGKCVCETTKCSTPGTLAICVGDTSYACETSVDGCKITGQSTPCGAGKCSAATGTCIGACTTNSCTSPGTSGRACKDGGSTSVGCGVAGGCPVELTDDVKACSPLKCVATTGDCAGCTQNACTGKTSGKACKDGTLYVCTTDLSTGCSVATGNKSCICNTDGSDCQTSCPTNGCTSPGTSGSFCMANGFESVPCGTQNGCPAELVGQVVDCSPNTCNTVTGACCTPQCSGKQCGPDGCNKTCGSCGANANCNGSGQCICQGSWLNCSGGWTDGCETDGSTDNAHCGKCDVSCTTDDTCVGGKCLPKNPTVTVSPTKLDFGNVTMGQSKPLTATIANKTGKSVTLVAEKSGSTAFTVSPPTSLGIGASTDVTVTFTAPSTLSTTTYNGILTLKWNTDTDSGQATLDLTGVAVVTAPSLSLSPPSLSFGKVIVNQSSSKTIQVVLSGNGTAQITSATVSGSGFSKGSDDCSATQLSSTSVSACYITVGFQPTAKVSYSGTLTVQTSLGTLTAPLSGSGDATCTDNCQPSDPVGCADSTHTKTCKLAGLCYDWSTSACGSRTICSSGSCVACGAQTQPCCADGNPCDSGAACVNSKCPVPDPCGTVSWTGSPSATSSTAGSATISWTQAPSDKQSCVAGYSVFRLQGAGYPSNVGSGCSASTTGNCLACETYLPTAATCTDSHATSGKMYVYAVYPKKTTSGFYGSVGVASVTVK